MELIWACTDGHPLVWRDATQLTVERVIEHVRALDVELYGEQTAANVNSEQYARMLFARLMGKQPP
jgi:hypothetical protein